MELEESDNDRSIQGKEARGAQDDIRENDDNGKDDKDFKAIRCRKPPRAAKLEGGMSKPEVAGGDATEEVQQRGSSQEGPRCGVPIPLPGRPQEGARRKVCEGKTPQHCCPARPGPPRQRTASRSRPSMGLPQTTTRRRVSTQGPGLHAEPWQPRML